MSAELQRSSVPRADWSSEGSLDQSLSFIGSRFDNFTIQKEEPSWQ